MSFSPNGFVECLDGGDTRKVRPLFIQGDWLCSLVACRQNLFPRIQIPNVQNLNLTADGTSVTVTWTGDSRYYTEIQYRNEGEDWVTLPLIEKGVDSY